MVDIAVCTSVTAPLCSVLLSTVARQKTKYDGQETVEISSLSDVARLAHDSRRSPLDQVIGTHCVLTVIRRL